MVGWKGDGEGQGSGRVLRQKREVESDCKGAKMGRPTALAGASSRRGDLPEDGEILLPQSGRNKRDVKK